MYAYLPTLQTPEKMSLTNTPLHNAIKRAFPQTDWPQKAIDLLSLYDEGEDIQAASLGYSEKEVLHDLATAGLIEWHRYPQFNRGMFGGYAVTYRYRKNLDYGPKAQPVNYWQKERKQTLIFGIALFAAAAAAFIYLILLIQKFS
jgi:hypothetical protein